MVKVLNWVERATRRQRLLAFLGFAAIQVVGFVLVVELLLVLTGAGMRSPFLFAVIGAFVFPLGDAMLVAVALYLLKREKRATKPAP